MKEQLFEILKVRRDVVYGDLPGLIADIEHLVNQEVERRIRERMPNEEEIEEWMQKNRWASARQYVNWLRFRLTPQVTTQDTTQVEKTECGYYTSEGRCLPGCMTDSCKHHPNNR